jgi:hypothetical protein
MINSVMARTSAAGLKALLDRLIDYAEPIQHLEGLGLL